LELLDHLGVEKAAVLGTSRGGLIAMALAGTAKERLAGVMLNDIGPVIEPEGLADIADYIGRNPASKTYAAVEAALAARLPGFGEVPDGRWREEAEKHYVETPDGLAINYDPALRDAFLAASEAPPVDLWPLFDAMEGLPLAGLRGENSNLLSPATFAEMHRRRPDMIAATVPGRGHVPFLDEPVSLEVLRRFLEAIR
jgi:pimeloyl-ACP methyl ester carboxylesterase